MVNPVSKAGAAPMSPGNGLFTICIVLLCTLLSQASFAAQLSATVDRDKIYENDTLNLTITGDIDLEFSFGGLLNFGRNQIPAPKIENLEQDFDILDQQQKYNMQSINGQTQAQVTWTYTLAPKRTGTLTIPAAKYKDGESEPIEIEVSAGTAPRNTQEPPRVFVEAEVDKESVYVQEQVRYTIRLYSADHLANGDLSSPSAGDSIVESLGDTQKYYRMRYNQRYEVRERQYLLFPQKSGQLDIEPQTFSGLIIDSRTRQRKRIRELSNRVELDVKAPPAEFSGDVWLPATSLHVNENWEQEPDNIMVGDSLTRTIEIKALGLLGEALPPISSPEISGLKLYPDQPEVESYEHEAGAQSVRRQSTALVAVSETQATLPEIRIPWWDTVNDVERVAVIPSRQLNIQRNPQVQQHQSAPAPQPTIASESDASTSETEDSMPSTGEPDQVIKGDSSSDWPWYLAVIFLASGWALTTWILLRRKPELTRNVPSNDQQAHVSTDALLKAVKQNHPDMPRLLVTWSRQHWHAASLRSLADLARFDTTLAEQAQAFERQLYAPQEDSSGYDSGKLKARIRSLEKSGETGTHSNSALQPLYPQS